MKKWYCTMWGLDHWVSCVFDNEIDAKHYVLNVIAGLDMYRNKTRGELVTIANTVGWNPQVLGYGLIELAASSEKACYNTEFEDA